MSKHAIIYARFSDRRDSEDSQSCEYQREFCENWCARNGYEVIGYYEDKAVSGATDIHEREGLSQALEAITKGVSIVAYHWDRFARDVRVFAFLEAFVLGRGGHLVSASSDKGTDGESIEEKLIRDILKSLAEFQRKFNAQRTRTSMLNYQKAGRVMSKILPYGRMLDPDNAKRREVDPKSPLRHIPCPEEQKVIQRILGLREKGLSWKRIADTLNEEGIKPRLAEEWKPATIGGILKREVKA